MKETWLFQIIKKVNLNQYNYNEYPEVLKETLRLFRAKMRISKQFEGTFQYGRIQGTVFSNTVLDVRKMISFVRVTGTYTYKYGTMSLKLSPSYGFKVFTSIYFTIGTLGTISTISSQEFHLLPMVFLKLGSAFTLLNLIMYQYMKIEFIQIIDSSMEFARNKLETTSISKTQNTQSKPPRLIPLE
jgi:hypothetical protein